MNTFYQYFAITIASGEVARVNAYSHFITLLTHTGAQNIQISIGGQAMQELPAGLSVELPQDQNFTYLEFKNTEAGPVTITFSLSSGAVQDNRSVVTGTLITNPSGNTFVTPAAIAVGVAAPGAPSIAADPGQREVIIQNNGANPIWAGDINVDGATGRGILIAVGASVVLSTEADIYLRSTGGASTASYARIKR